ncbi:MAG: prepilin-type N-terminal cleavage/methylation domain-containing protein [Bacteroidetes bacterium]|nr:MAG: prepilin-type N-terminal cleavage/methylation domain-containing protein [Bacteroidota bacterium]
MSMSSTRGFTLIELLVTMVIALILLAGLTSNFISQSNVARTQSDRAMTSEDLVLASQIMRRELKTAIGSTVAISSPNTTDLVLKYVNVDLYAGAFWYNHPASTGGRLGPGSLCWIRPSIHLDPPTDPLPASATCTGNDELLVGLDPTAGMDVYTDTGTDPYTWTVTLKGEFRDVDKQVRPMELKFSIWPRNRR